MTERSRVVLPAPLRPTRVTTSPWPTRRGRRRAGPAPRRTRRTARGPRGGRGRAQPWSSPPSVPEVGRDDPLVGAHLLVGPLGEHRTGLQHRHPVGERADDVHVVVDEARRCGPLATRLTSAMVRSTSSTPMPAVGSSSSSSAGVEREGEGELEGALLPVGERAGEHPGPVGEADLVEQVHRRAAGTGASASGSARTGSRARSARPGRARRGRRATSGRTGW